MLETQQAQGLYDPRYEHDACGFAVVARLDNKASNEVIALAIEALANLEHRGAAGADSESGDGAGLLMQMPDSFLRAVTDFELPARGDYGVAMCFMPTDPSEQKALMELLESVVVAEGQRVLGWREVPVDASKIGPTARASQPMIRQLFVGADNAHDEDAFERKLYVIRRVCEKKCGERMYISSCSARTLVYKGMLISFQLRDFYIDLADTRMASVFALVHSRFSTNTFPSWELAHPYRVLAHNGEINTLRGNINWMRARESQMASAVFGADLAKILPVVQANASDSSTLDSVLELLMLSGRSLPHAIMMLIPEAYRNRDGDLPPELGGFYAFHSCFMEPWDGPAAVAFTDGRLIGATLDRNGLRPGRWLQTKDGLVVLGSEAGLLEIAASRIQHLGRLQPGKLFLIDVAGGRIIPDHESKLKVASQQPYGKWYDEHSIHFDDLTPEVAQPLAQPLTALQLAFGYSREDIVVTLPTMIESAEEPIGSMGNDNALAVLSDHTPTLFAYFKQLFAQVTNPPIDPIRESIVMSVAVGLGAAGNLLEEKPSHAHQLQLDEPILRNHELATLRAVENDIFKPATIDITWDKSAGAEGMDAALTQVCEHASAAIAEGSNIIILSDRAVGPARVPIPSLLAVAGVHHHLVRAGTRLQTGLVVESGDARQVHHIATLVSYGASAVNPWLMFETVGEVIGEGDDKGEAREVAEDNVRKAISKGLLKTISKMGISTIQSYCGAQIFEAVGLSQTLIERHFTGTASRIGGIGIEVLAAEALARHERAFPSQEGALLPVGGVYAWRRGGEHHQWNPDTISLLQHAVRGEGVDAAAAYAEFARLCDEDSGTQSTVRGLLKIREDLTPIPLNEVEPWTEIVKRFATGAMSLGSLSREAHENLALAMNEIGGKSNTGEGGEDSARFVDKRRSAIKQVASGRFGVTIEYLVNADEIQIKMAQGAKPGEGGQLPGNKVDAYIGGIRHSTPGVGLISPPPHHDIYSIEDLKQLIYDLRCANPNARISVKLVAEAGVGTVAAGVAKANSDHVLISGHDGGTGASPLSSIYGAGIPWEIGLAETQQTLLRNDLRSRIYVQVDGQLKTGRDVVIAAALGADEMGFASAPLVASGCIMMRACHLNTCPVGIATQDPELRKRFAGTPEHVINYFHFVAEDVRRILASLGLRTLTELIGHTEFLDAANRSSALNWKTQGLTLTDLLLVPPLAPEAPRSRTRNQEPVLGDALDWQLIEDAQTAIYGGDRVRLHYTLRNTNRCVGGLLANAITRAHGDKGLAEGAVEAAFAGVAGQSFGAWLTPGIDFTLHGVANDYVGKGLSGGVITVRPPADADYVAEDNVIIGNTVLYGATSGRAFFRGLAGERFAVRNSGAHAVVEGVGDHGCEYMTGGRVVVLGATGRNFAAGMSGGIAYVYDVNGEFKNRCNRTTVTFETMSEADAVELHALVREHGQRTGSVVAARVLADYEQTLKHFIKVMPNDYRRVLDAQIQSIGAS
jgi:glutamate synthase (NADPH/NADH) large chain/glutamate synthase (ferredoxin)